MRCGQGHKTSETLCNDIDNACKLTTVAFIEECQVIFHCFTITVGLIVCKLLRTSGWNGKCFLPHVFLDERVNCTDYSVSSKIKSKSCSEHLKCDGGSPSQLAWPHVLSEGLGFPAASSRENHSFRAPLFHTSANLMKLAHSLLIISYRAPVPSI